MQTQYITVLLAPGFAGGRGRGLEGRRGLEAKTSIMVPVCRIGLEDIISLAQDFK